MEGADWLVDRVLEGEAGEWMRASELAKDARTREVVECLDFVRDMRPMRLGDDVLWAIEAAHYFRAPEVESVSYDEIPGLISEAVNILKGYETHAALKDHCESPEEVFGACALKLATRWTRGKQGYKWCFEEVGRAWSDGEMLHPPLQMSVLRDAQKEMVD